MGYKGSKHALHEHGGGGRELPRSRVPEPRRYSGMFSLDHTAGGLGAEAMMKAGNDAGSSGHRGRSLGGAQRLRRQWWCRLRRRRGRACWCSPEIQTTQSPPASIQPHSRTHEHRTMERGSLCCQSAQRFLGFFPLYKLKREMGIAPPDAACPP
jgi:hypothetical protein